MFPWQPINYRHSRLILLGNKTSEWKIMETPGSSLILLFTRSSFVFNRIGLEAETESKINFTGQVPRVYC